MLPCRHQTHPENRGDWCLFHGGVAVMNVAPALHPSAGKGTCDASPALFHRCGYAMLKKHSRFYGSFPMGVLRRSNQQNRMPLKRQVGGFMTNHIHNAFPGKDTIKESGMSGRDVSTEAPALFVMPFGWEAYGVQAGFTGRKGGVSPPPYQSLNLSFTRNDAVKHVLENHRRVSQALGCTCDDMVRVRQVHDARVAVVDRTAAGIQPETEPERDGVDALVTQCADLVLLTSHADCVPVYFLDPENGVIGLAHAGWGGVLAGVVEATIATMQTRFGSKPSCLKVGIGPHIRSCCFAVKEDVSDRFAAMPWWHSDLLEIRGTETFLNLSGCIRAILTQYDICPDAVREATDCTCCESEQYFSHRGSGGHTGTGSAWLRRYTSLLGGLLCSLTLLLSGCSEISGLSEGLGLQTPARDQTGAGAPSATTAMGASMQPEETVGPLTGMGTVLLQDTGPAAGGTLRLFILNPEELDPLNTLNPEVVDCGWFLSDPLVIRTEEGLMRPFVAKEVLSSQEGRVWDITLREDILFWDGTSLEAEDVLATLKQAAGSVNGIHARGLRNLEKTEVIGRHRFRLILRVADPLFTRNLRFPIFSADSWKPSQEGTETQFIPNGLGAYRLAESNSEAVVLHRNESWWAGAPEGPVGHPAWPEQIHFLIGSSEADRLTFFQQRRIDATWTVDADTSRYQNRTDIEVRTFPGNRMEFAVIGSRSTQLSREPIRTLLLRYLSGVMTETVRSGDPVSDSRFLPLSLEQVIPLLVEAGCRYQQKGDSKPVLSIPGTNGLRPAALTIGYNALSVERLKSAQWMADMLQPLGITPYLQEISVEASKKLVASGQFDLLLLGGDFPPDLSDADMLTEMRKVVPASVAEVFPLYRERRSMLYNTRIRGEKEPTATSALGGWQDWYLLEPHTGGTQP